MEAANGQDTCPIMAPGFPTPVSGHSSYPSTANPACSPYTTGGSLCRQAGCEQAWRPGGLWEAIREFSLIQFLNKPRGFAKGLEGVGLSAEESWASPGIGCST